MDLISLLIPAPVTLSVVLCTPLVVAGPQIDVDLFVTGVANRTGSFSSSSTGSCIKIQRSHMQSLLLLTHPGVQHKTPSFCQLVGPTPDFLSTPKPSCYLPSSFHCYQLNSSPFSAEPSHTPKHPLQFQQIPVSNQSPIITIEWISPPLKYRCAF